MLENPPPSPTGSIDTECPICFYPFEDDDYYDVDCCGKRLHIACLESWKRTQGLRKPTCPCCRSEKLDVLEMGEYPEDPQIITVPPGGLRDPILSLANLRSDDPDPVVSRRGSSRNIVTDQCCRVILSCVLLMGGVYFIMSIV